jgi:hypothetical protein
LCRLKISRDGNDLADDATERYRESIRLVDEGGELPEGVVDRKGFRRNLEGGCEELVDRMADNRRELRVARELVKRVDPEVRRLREERVKKYNS